MGKHPGISTESGSLFEWCVLWICERQKDSYI